MAAYGQLDGHHEGVSGLYQLLDRPAFLNIGSDVRQTFSDGERFLEGAYGRQLASQKEIGLENFQRAPLFYGFSHLTDMEETLLRAQGYAAKGESSKVAFVGMAGLPASPLLLNEKIRLHIDCIDHVEESVEVGETLARKATRTVGGSILNFVSKPAHLVDYHGYSVVFVSARAMPKIKLLRKIAAAKSVEYMIVRTVNDPATVFYNRMNPHEIANEGFLLRQYTEATPPFFQASLLYENTNFSAYDRDHRGHICPSMVDEAWKSWYRPGGNGFGGGWNNFVYTRHLNSTHFSSYQEGGGASQYRAIKVR